MKEITGYSKYFITKDGRVFSKKTNRFLKTTINNAGYCYVCLCKNNKKKTFNIHRLVASEYLKKTKNKPEVNHINGIKTDNRLNNLEFCTRSENQRHSYINGLQKIKLTPLQAMEIYNDTRSTRTIAKDYGIDHSNVSRIKNKIKWISLWE